MHNIHFQFINLKFGTCLISEQAFISKYRKHNCVKKGQHLILILSKSIIATEWIRNGNHCAYFCWKIKEKKN